MTKEEVKQLIKRERLFHYEIADVLGIREPDFSKWFRKELSPEREEKILNAIKILTRKGH